MSAKRGTVVVLVGPTAVGKTAVSLELAKLLGTEIVSADSRQCYKGMRIGTAMPTVQELAEVKHHFINEYPVTDLLDAADFERIALAHVSQILNTHDCAVVVGGTGLYIKAFCEGLDPMPEVNEEISQSVNALYKQHGLAWLQQQIAEHDPRFYTAGEIHNPARLMRALIFKLSTGGSILDYRTGQSQVRPFNMLKVGLELPRSVLYERINKRVDTMLEAGLLAEVQGLGEHRGSKNLDTVGYSELFAYLDGVLTLPKAIDLIKQHTRNYAKRQMTWFKKDVAVRWLSLEGRSALEVAEEVVTIMPHR